MPDDENKPDAGADAPVEQPSPPPTGPEPTPLGGDVTAARARATELQGKFAARKGH